MFVLSLVTTNQDDVATTATNLAPPTSSATFDLKNQPCRHGRQAWYGALSRGAGGVAFSDLTARIFKTSSGRFYVPVARDRAQILDLGRDSAVSCFIALSSAATNAQVLESETGRAAKLSDLYLAHVFGTSIAVRLMKAIDTMPDRRMATVFPGLERIEPDIYRGKGASMTMADFSKKLRRAIKQRINGAGGKTKTASRQQRRKSKIRNRDAAPKSIVQIIITPVSARAINRRQPPIEAPITRVSQNKVTRHKVSRHGMSGHDVSGYRFDFGRGLNDRLDTH